MLSNQIKSKFETKNKVQDIIASTIEKEVAKVGDTLKTTVLDAVQECIKQTIKQTIDDHLEQLHFDLKDCQDHHLTVKEFKKTQTSLLTRVTDLEKENLDLRKRLIRIEMHSRKLNMKMLGIKEEKDENVRNKIMKLFQETGAAIDEQDLVTAHRVPTKVKPSPIIIRLSNLDIKGKIWNLSHQLRSKFNIRIEDDLPIDIYRARKVLKPVAFEAKRLSKLHPENRYNVRWKDDSLQINGQAYTLENLNLLPEELHPRNVFTRVHGDKVPFFSSHSPLTNHHPSPIQIEGLKFSCSEQYFMLAKARAFGDEAQAQQIMATSNPVEQKQLGSKITGFKKEVWEKKMENVMENALKAKFLQNVDLK